MFQWSNGKRNLMTERLYQLRLTGKEPSLLLLALLDARDKKELEFAETRSPEVLEELLILRRLTKTAFHLIVGESVVPSMN